MKFDVMDLLQKSDKAGKLLEAKRYQEIDLEEIKLKLENFGSAKC